METGVDDSCIPLTPDAVQAKFRQKNLPKTPGSPLVRQECGSIPHDPSQALLKVAVLTWQGGEIAQD